tara:strand:+ start:4049 stop:4864 length:816 start_codon:yes stop_codon:yes gene_type:complete
MNIMDKKVGFIGAGNMASALISGMITAGFKPEHIMASSPGKSHLDFLSDNFGVKTSNDNELVFKESEVLIFAVKPNILKTVLEEYKNISPKEVLLISVAAGFKILDIETILSSEQRIIRAMPNTPSSIRSGVTAISINKNATEDDQQNAEDLFSCVGEVVHIREREMDLYTALIGSGPAYIFYLMESLLDSSIGIEMDEDTKKNMIASMIAGSAKLALMSENSPKKLRENVTSPGGVTQRAIEEFEKNGMKEIVIEAIEAAARKSKELGGN